ncbi:MAG: metallophosphoesterase [Thermoproteota archaeon]
MMKMMTTLRPVNPYPALIIESGKDKILVISDLHIGWETSLSEKGVHIPSQTNKILRRVEQILALEEPNHLIVLGDVKHTIVKIELGEWRDVPEFFEKLLKKIEHIKVVPGNHDGNIETLLPSRVEVTSQRGIILGEVGLFHGHAWPDIKMLGCKTLVIGHIHPVITFEDPMRFRITSQVWVKAPCNKLSLIKAALKRYKVKLKAEEDPEKVLKEDFGIKPKVEDLIIMPSFNDVLSGRAINRALTLREDVFKDFIGPVLQSGGAMLNKAEIYMLDGTFIGFLNDVIKLNKQ